MAKAVKLADIAKKLGVSTVTVSKALSDKKGVSEDMRQKIKVLANEMGYRQPSAKKRLKPRNTYNIGVLVSEHYLGKYDSFYWQMYQAVTTKAIQKECFTILEVISEENEKKCVLPKVIQEKKADGLIIIGRLERNYLDALNDRAGVPIIYLDFYEEKQKNDAVISDSFYGAYQLTDYLIEMGHKKLAFVGTILSSSSITDRYLGFTKALLEHQLEQRKEWLIEDRNLEDGRIDTVNKLTIPQDMPTAFVCNCDLTASELIRKLTDQGYRIPEDVSIVGFDNYLYPGLCDVAITTYEVDINEMARKAVYALLRQMTNSHMPVGIDIVEGHMVLKDSVRRID
ncbi:MAG: LacI family DNA-binding transcriptional regulator [Lachnospiraceae bacterium]